MEDNRMQGFSSLQAFLDVENTTVAASRQHGANLVYGTQFLTINYEAMDPPACVGVEVAIVKKMIDAPTLIA